MSWLYGDSFDGYATADLPNRYSTIGLVANVTIQAGAGRYGGGALRVVDSYVGVSVTPGSAVGIWGMAYKTPTTGPAGAACASIYDGVSARTHVIFVINSDGSISAYRCDSNSSAMQSNFSVTLLGSTAAGLVAAGTYVHLGFRVKIHATLGEVQIYINGATRLNLTNQNTKNATATGTSFSQIYVGSYVASGAYFIDDLYVLDDQGATANAFLGDLVAEWRVGTGDGTTTQFTKSSGATNASCIDDGAPDGDSTVVTSSTLAQKDTYTHAALINIASGVECVQVVTVARKTSGGTRAIKHVIRSGGSDYDGATDQYLGTGYATQITPWTTDPATSAAWTVSAVNASELGQKVSV